MKYFYTLFSILLSVSLSAQGTCSLNLVDDKIVGECENTYFTDFEILLDKQLSKLDSQALFKQLPLKGTIIINKQHKLSVTYTQTLRAGFPQILFKTEVGWFTMDSLHIQNSQFNFKIDQDPDVPVTEVDLKIIKKAKSLLSQEKSWHKNDDRNCEDDIESGSYSLFCALKSASIEFEGAYNHRNAIMQKIRHTIVSMFPEKKWEHRLKDFNNMPETDYKVLMDLLNRVEKEVVSELEEK